MWARPGVAGHCGGRFTNGFSENIRLDGSDECYVYLSGTGTGVAQAMAITAGLWVGSRAFCFVSCDEGLWSECRTA